MLVWRAQHLDRTMTGMLVEGGGIGRWPDLPPGWSERTCDSLESSPANWSDAHE
jgi:hypothetical protein